MAVDTPARIAILGAGPIGLEAALYARFLGYDVDLFERGEVAQNVLDWGHVRMFSPFGMNHSTLGEAAIRAQDETWQAPADEALLTGQEWVERYLAPLSQTDLLADHIRTRTTVVAVSRQDLLKTELPGDESRGDAPFRVLVRDAQGTESESLADIVIDTTGVYRNPNWMGPGGAPALGETDARASIEYGLADILGTARATYEGRHTLVIGSGYSAATSVVALAELAQQAPATRVTWATRRACDSAAPGPVMEIANDRLAERQGLATRANALARGAQPAVAHRAETTVAAIRRADDRWCVRFAGAEPGEGEFDRIIANVGFRPDNRLFAELQVHECYATQGPMKLAASLLQASSADCLEQTSHGPQTLLHPEPNFYLLGAKSHGRSSNFLVAVGLAQIQELFTVIGDRADLDLYAGAKRLLS